MILPNKHIYLKLITLTYMGAILYSSFLPYNTSAKSTSVTRLFHNLLHIPVYAILTYLLLRCFDQANIKKTLYSASIAFSWGVLNEFAQSFAPDRTASLSDALLNGLGIMLILIWAKYFNLQNKTRKDYLL